MQRLSHTNKHTNTKNLKIWICWQIKKQIWVEGNIKKQRKQIDNIKRQCDKERTKKTDKYRQTDRQNKATVIL